MWEQASLNVTHGAFQKKKLKLKKKEETESVFNNRTIELDTHLLETMCLLSAFL